MVHSVRPRVNVGYRKTTYFYLTHIKRLLFYIHILKAEQTLQTNIYLAEKNIKFIENNTLPVNKIKY